MLKKIQIITFKIIAKIKTSIFPCFDIPLQMQKKEILQFNIFL